ncbi:MAG: transcriptional repressor LexA [Candidatus Puniceispirillaceae bacterium]
MLTAKQRDLLQFLKSYQDEHDHAPSFDEMKDAIGLKSKSGIHRLVSALEERGHIRRLANRARAIEIIDNPVATPMDKPEQSGNVIKGHFETASTLSLPLLGQIAAGTPIEALSDNSRFLDVPASMIGSGEHFALEIVGDSMVDAGIHDGDTVVIKKTDIANHGDIVVALIDEHEATLKTLRKEDGRIGLEPANRHYQTRYFSSNAVRIQGKLAGLIRNYS